MTGLIPESPPEPEEKIKYVNLVNIENYDHRYKADLAKGLLLVYDIDSVIQAGRSAPASETPVRLFVKEGDVMSAKEILRNAEEEFI